jgi:hypothetical protein
LNSTSDLRELREYMDNHGITVTSGYRKPPLKPAPLTRPARQRRLIALLLAVVAVALELYSGIFMVEPRWGLGIFIGVIVGTCAWALWPRRLMVPDPEGYPAHAQNSYHGPNAPGGGFRR